MTANGNTHPCPAEGDDGCQSSFLHLSFQYGVWPCPGSVNSSTCTFHQGGQSKTNHFLESAPIFIRIHACACPREPWARIFPKNWPSIFKWTDTAARGPLITHLGCVIISAHVHRLFKRQITNPLSFIHRVAGQGYMRTS